MELTIDQVQKICLLSDGNLYDEAVNFIAEHPDYTHSKVSKAQLSGLQNAVGAGDWNEILLYINNRLNRKTTPKAVKRFYGDLKDYLNGDLKGYLNDLLTLTTEPCAYLLAKEFIQHLVAEYNYRRSV